MMEKMTLLMAMTTSHRWSGRPGLIIIIIIINIFIIIIPPFYGNDNLEQVVGQALGPNIAEQMERATQSVKNIADV